MDAGEGLTAPGWIAAGDLRPGDVLRTATGPGVAVEGLRSHVGYAVVYTLTVAKDHTFFVGSAKVLVHNATCEPIKQAIKDALASTDEGLREEAQVADYLVKQGYDVLSFHKDIPGTSGLVGDIDIETSHALIEVTTASQKKLPQVRKLLTNLQMNPTHKPVILFAKNYSRFADEQFKAIGARIVRSETELIEALQELGDQ